MKTLIMVLCFMTISTAQTKYNNVNEEISKGNFTEASRLIDEIILKGGISETEIYDLNFEKEKMDRIRKDFKKTVDDVLTYIRKYNPDAKESDIERWEKDKSLEYKIIDGKKYYFNRAHTNFFRINKIAALVKTAADGDQKGDHIVFLEKYLPKVIDEAIKQNSSIVMPQKFKINYKLTVDADAVPDGEIIRCWLPFPREGHKRQTDIKLISANTENYIMAPNSIMQRTLYMEKRASKGIPTIFEYDLEFTGLNEWNEIRKGKIEPYNTESELYKKFTDERPPHIVFTDKIKDLSKKIVGDETDKFLIAKRIYKWINDNIPWAGAREYSTLDNISDYCITNGHGDCGIKTLTFMTLARYNGIPTKWQSGWMLHPGSKNLHDWAEMYLEGYGWVPVDQSFGLIDSKDESVKWFFLGGLDAYHFIVNDDYSSDLYPAKIYPRSETVDFQRGEVEWEGGNLYFDKWDYHMEIEYLD